MCTVMLNTLYFRNHATIPQARKTARPAIAPVKRTHSVALNKQKPIEHVLAHHAEEL
jgi:hypothetical protein